MSSRHQRIYRKRGKDQHVICVNCNVRLKLDDGKGGYRKRFPLTNRLQDRKWDPSRKPGISILEGLVETIPDLAAGNISQILSAMCLCHGCFILLRQVVNCKFKVQNLLVELQQKIGDITNEMRLETNKQAETDDKVIKCWVCQEKFTNKATKFAMHRHVQDELTVKEAIETLLPEESATLQGVSKKYLLICKNCFKILNKIIMSQCQAETTRQSFIETTSEDGLISKILEQGDDFDILDDDDGNDYEEDDNKHTEVVVPSASETVPSADMLVVKTELNTEVQASENCEGETEAQSVILVLTGSSVQSGEKRKLQQTCSLIEEDTSEAALTEMYDGLEYQEEKNSKRRKPDVDVLSILQSTNSENEEAQADLGDDLLDAELDEGTLIVDEEDTAEQLSENCLKKVVYYLQQNLFRQAFNILKKNSTIFEEEFQKMVINYIKKETSECDNLENTDWTKLSSLHSGAVTLESYVEVFQENLPLLSAVLSYSIAGQRHVDFTRIEKATLQRLLTVMGVIAFERNPNCHLLQSLNSIQMAEDGCTRELYNTFYGLGLCLKEKDTQKLLTTPDYSTHQVCWHLLKEAQEVRGSKDAKKDNAKVLKEEDRDLDTDEDYDSLPDDFADVCPYWKLPKTTLSDNDTSSDEWVLYYDPKAAGRAEPIRLIFQEAGVPYKECEEPYDRKEINGGKITKYPTFSLPVVRKGSLTLTQLPVICRHLGELFGLSPDSADDKLQAEQICHTCHDYLVEARITLQEVDSTENSQTDKEATEPVEAGATRLYEKETTKPHIDRFTKNRIPRFLSFFETALKANNSDRGFFFGDKLTYPDLAVLHILRATENYFPEVYKRTTDIPQLKTFRDSISSRPRLKAYFESDRSKVTAGNSV